MVSTMRRRASRAVSTSASMWSASKFMCLLYAKCVPQVLPVDKRTFKRCFPSCVLFHDDPARICAVAESVENGGEVHTAGTEFGEDPEPKRVMPAQTFATRPLEDGHVDILEVNVLNPIAVVV